MNESAYLRITELQPVKTESLQILKEPVLLFFIFAGLLLFGTSRYVHSEGSSSDSEKTSYRRIVLKQGKGSSSEDSSAAVSEFGRNKSKMISKGESLKLSARQLPLLDLAALKSVSASLETQAGSLLDLLEEVDRKALSDISSFGQLGQGDGSGNSESQDTALREEISGSSLSHSGSVEDLEVLGGLTKDQVSFTVAQSRSDFKACLAVTDQYFDNKSGIVLSWKINSKGVVKDLKLLKDEGTGKPLINCIVSSVERMVFPRAANQSESRVIMPFHFRKAR